MNKSRSGHWNRPNWPTPRSAPGSGPHNRIFAINPKKRTACWGKLRVSATMRFSGSIANDISSQQLFKPENRRQVSYFFDFGKGDANPTGGNSARNPIFACKWSAKFDLFKLEKSPCRDEPHSIVQEPGLRKWRFF